VYGGYVESLSLPADDILLTLTLILHYIYFEYNSIMVKS